MKLTECYNTLNVSPESRWEEVKKSYHFLARKYHPDAHAGRPGFELKFRKITQAFKTLETSYRTDHGAKGNGKQTNSRSSQAGNPGAAALDEPLVAVPIKSSPTRLHTHKKNDSGNKEGLSQRLRHFGQALFELERNAFLLDMKKNIYLKKRLANQANIIRLKTGKDNFQVRIPPGPWTRMFIRIPNKGNKSFFSQKRGDLILNITVPGCDALTPTNPAFHYKVRIPRASLAANKVWVLKSTDGPIRFTLPQNTEDGQKFTLKSSASKDETTDTSHILTVHLV